MFFLIKRFSRFAFLVLLLPLVACGSCNSKEISVADRNQEVGPDIVYRACYELFNNYYDPNALNYIQLLNAGLDGLQSALKDKKIEFKPAKIPANSSYENGRKLFSDELDKAKALIGKDKVKEKNELVFASVSALCNSVGDSHTYFISPDIYAQELKRQNGRAAYGGIGALLRKLEDGFFYFDIVYENNPAAKAGIQRFDRLISVDRRPLPGTVSEIVDAIRGPPGAERLLTIQRAGKDLEIKVICDNVVIPSATHEIIRQKDAAIGYLRLYHFDLQGIPDILTFFDDLQKSEAKGIVIDVRSNPGGSVLALNTIFEFFLKAGTDTFYEKKPGHKHQYSTSLGQYTNLPVVVLLNNESGSAAEIFSAVMQENARAVLVGEKSGGHVSEGIAYSLPYGAAIMVTVAQIYTAKDKKLENVGVKPDVEVKLDNQSIESGKDVQLDEAIKKLSPR